MVVRHNPFHHQLSRTVGIDRPLRHVLRDRHAMRYFNAAGADPEGELGESHAPETHLIPLILDAAGGTRESARIYGTDYPTPDGTCIRDYIHVTDLADAHIRALEYLKAGGESSCFNLGNGNGDSVAHVISVAQKVTGRDFAVRKEGRRIPPLPVSDKAACSQQQPKACDKPQTNIFSAPFFPSLSPCSILFPLMPLPRMFYNRLNIADGAVLGMEKYGC